MAAAVYVLCALGTANDTHPAGPGPDLGRHYHGIRRVPCSSSVLASTRDRLFAVFSAAFWVLAIQRLALALSEPIAEWRTGLYMIRLLGFLLILGAIADKNRSRTDGPLSPMVHEIAARRARTRDDAGEPDVGTF